MVQIEIEEELKKGKERLIEQQEKEKNNLVELERKYMEQVCNNLSVF
jgi:hypothetical protein